MVPLKYLSNFWGTLKMVKLRNCEVSLILTWSANYFLVFHTAAHQVTTFRITDTKLYAPVITLSSNDIAKLLQ